MGKLNREASIKISEQIKCAIKKRKKQLISLETLKTRQNVEK